MPVRFRPRAPRIRPHSSQNVRLFLWAKMRKSPASGAVLLSVSSPQVGRRVRWLGGWRGNVGLHGRLRRLAVYVCNARHHDHLPPDPLIVRLSTMAAAKCLAPAPGLRQSKPRPRRYAACGRSCQPCGARMRNKGRIACTPAEPLARPWCSMNPTTAGATISCTCVPAIGTIDRNRLRPQSPHPIRTQRVHIQLLPRVDINILQRMRKYFCICPQRGQLSWRRISLRPVSVI